jgi:hypothetical protein
MIVKGIIAVLALSLAGFSGCTKTTAPSASAKAGEAGQSSIKDLGVLQLTNHFETNVKFGPGRSCRIVPKMLDRHSVQLTLTVESKRADGSMAGFSVVQLVGDTGSPFQVAIGSTNFTFTPQIADSRSF